ncbi:MAG: hypothetical protein WBA45_03290 [Microthrixaceae bacterium]
MDRRRPVGALILLLAVAAGLLPPPVAADEVPAGEQFPAPYSYDAPADALAQPTGGPSAQGALLQGPGSANSAAAVAAGGAATTSSLLTYTPRTAGGLADAASGAWLNARLAADEIASGHSYTKHVVERGEFPGIRTRTQFADMVENVINNYDDLRHLSGGRTAYWRDGVVVIRNPRAPDGGTAFVPRDGYDYFLGLG